MVNVTVLTVSVSYIFGICFPYHMLENSLRTALRCSEKCLHLRPSTVAIPFVMTSVPGTPSNVNIAFLYNSSSCQRKLLIAFLMEKLLLFQNSSRFSDMRKQAMYVYLYIDAPSHNHFCREKATSITFFVGPGS